eukprot:GHVH01014590.1.p3 GENE.GHVH01014590.1~~GHVH01014590.1.p3  ORF type:complete len:112 (-),score=16.93 GHVH01014590.1:98-433(-)
MTQYRCDYNNDFLQRTLAASKVVQKSLDAAGEAQYKKMFGDDDAAKEWFSGLNKVIESVASASFLGEMMYRPFDLTATLRKAMIAFRGEELMRVGRLGLLCTVNKVANKRG